MFLSSPVLTPPKRREYLVTPLIYIPYILIPLGVRRLWCCPFQDMPEYFLKLPIYLSIHHLHCLECVLRPFHLLLRCMATIMETSSDPAIYSIKKGFKYDQNGKVLCSHMIEIEVCYGCKIIPSHDQVQSYSRTFCSREHARACSTTGFCRRYPTDPDRWSSKGTSLLLPTT